MKITRKNVDDICYAVNRARVIPRVLLGLYCLLLYDFHTHVDLSQINDTQVQYMAALLAGGAWIGGKYMDSGGNK